MEEDYVGGLIKELSRHSETFEFDESKFTNFLTSFEIPESYGFSEDIEESLENREYLITFKKDHKILLKKIIRNENAEERYLSGLGKRWETALSKIGVYDPCEVVRNLRTNKGLLSLMSSSDKKGNSFSLLADFRAYHHNSGRESTTHRPILVIPGISDKEMKIVYEWEDENTVCEKDSRILGITSGF